MASGAACALHAAPLTDNQLPAIAIDHNRLNHDIPPAIAVAMLVAEVAILIAEIAIGIVPLKANIPHIPFRPAVASIFLNGLNDAGGLLHSRFLVRAGGKCPSRSKQ